MGRFRFLETQCIFGSYNTVTTASKLLYMWGHSLLKVDSILAKFSYDTAANIAEQLQCIVELYQVLKLQVQVQVQVHGRAVVGF